MLKHVCLLQQQVSKHETNTQSQGELQGCAAQHVLQHQGCAAEHAPQEQGRLQLNAAHSASQYQRQNRGASLSNEDLLESTPYRDQIIQSIHYTRNDAKWTDSYKLMYTCHS